jgi:hypothetical protein
LRSFGGVAEELDPIMCWIKQDLPWAKLGKFAESGAGVPMGFKLHDLHLTHCVSIWIRSYG